MNNVKKSIGWADYTINPVKGLCPVGCSYCYARRLYDRFKWDKSIRYDPTVFMTLPNKPSRIFVGSTIDLFHPLTSIWNEEILSLCRRNPEHTFIFLTKLPENLPEKFPDNVWVGVSATNFEQFGIGLMHLINDIKATVKFFSFEPLLTDIAPDKKYAGYNSELMSIDLKNVGINWVIIGAQSPHSEKTFPKWEWVENIIEACDKVSIPIFLKDNLGLPKLSCEGGIPFYKQSGGTMKLRQEFPVTQPVERR